MQKQLIIIDDDSAFRGSSRSIGDVKNNELLH